MCVEYRTSGRAKIDQMLWISTPELWNESLHQHCHLEFKSWTSTQVSPSIHYLYAHFFLFRVTGSSGARPSSPQVKTGAKPRNLLQAHVWTNISTPTHHGQFRITNQPNMGVFGLCEACGWKPTRAQGEDGKSTQKGPNGDSNCLAVKQRYRPPGQAPLRTKTLPPKKHSLEFFQKLFFNFFQFLFFVNIPLQTLIFF